MLRERVRENIYLSADSLGSLGKVVSKITETKFRETNSHGSIAYRLCINSEGQEYTIRVDHIWDSDKGESLTIWHNLGRFDFHELPYPQVLRLQNWWKLNYPASPFKIVRSNNGDLILGTKKPLAEFDDNSLLNNIISLVDSIPQAKQELQKKFN